jgi:hypothetical protein
MISTANRAGLEEYATALTATIEELTAVIEGLQDDLVCVNDALDATNVDAGTWGGRRGAPVSASDRGTA